MSTQGLKRPVIKSLLTLASTAFERVRAGNCGRETSYSAHDCLMSGLAIFLFKMPSMLAFDQARQQDPALMANLRTLCGIEQAPSDATLRRRLDRIDPKHVHRVLRTTFGWLRRHRLLEPFRAAHFDHRVPVMLDGTHYFTSTKVHCTHCLQSTQRDGGIRYRHGVLAAVVAHPDVAQVLPIAVEPIVQDDGVKKQDCEQHAFQRLLPRLVRERQRLPLIIMADALYATEPVVATLAAHDQRFILTCKAARHQHALSHLAEQPFESVPAAGSIMLFRWRREVPLNASAGQDRLVTVVEQRAWHDGRESCWTWVTDLPVHTAHDAWEVARLARRRWAVENETFQVLKSRDRYHAEHNDGHGTEHLCTIMFLLMMVAFLYDQIAALKCALFQAAKTSRHTMRSLWETQRVFLRYIAVGSWDEFYARIAGTWPQAP